jgi:hypothetical protein
MDVLSWFFSVVAIESFCIIVPIVTDTFSWRAVRELGVAGSGGGDNKQLEPVFQPSVTAGTGKNC